MKSACASVDVVVEWAGRMLTTGTADFGEKQALPVHHDAEVVVAEPLDGSTGLMNTNIFGKIVLIEHGIVSIVEKAVNAQKAGAIAVIIFNSADKRGHTTNMKVKSKIPLDFFVWLLLSILLHIFLLCCIASRPSVIRAKMASRSRLSP